VESDSKAVASALSLFLPLDATVIVLGWSLGTAVLFVAIAAIVGRDPSRSGGQTLR